MRPGELRKAHWSEMNLDKAEWRIPAERMKMGEQHIVPLADQAVDDLRELEPLTNPGSETDLSDHSMAAYAFTGIATRPKERVPERMGMRED